MTDEIVLFSQQRPPAGLGAKWPTVFLPNEKAAERFFGFFTGLRDRALIAIMVYTFARIGAALQMNVGDYFSQGCRGWVRLHEKGGKEHEAPCIPKLGGPASRTTRTGRCSAPPGARQGRRTG
jgi:hypothetical protein